MASLAVVAGMGAVLITLAATCAALGRLLTLGATFGDRWEQITMAECVGLAAGAHILFVLGLTGLLDRRVILVLFGTVLSLEVLAAARWASSSHRHLVPDRRMLSMLPSIVLGSAFFVPVLLLACYPPIAFDETLYHLPFARAFVKNGGLLFLPQLRVPVFPPLTELLFAGMLLFVGDVATHLVSLLAVVLTAAILFVWGRNEFSSRIGGLAAALYLGNPIVTQLSSTAYVDPFLALLVTATLYSVARHRIDRSSKWIVFGAFFSGSAAATKYLGLFFVPAALILLMLSAPGETRALKLRIAVLFCSIASATALPVYARIFYYTGNPVFPFLPNVFGSSLWDPAPSTYATLATRLMGSFTLPWKAVFDPASVGRQAPISPFLLLLAPLLLLALSKRTTTRWFVTTSIIYGFAVPPDARYLLPVLPVICLAESEMLSDVIARLARLGTPSKRAITLIYSCGGLFLLPAWLYTGRAIVHRGMPPTNYAERIAFLSRHFPAYPAIEFLNRNFGSRYTVYAVHSENLVYMADGTVLGDWTGPASFARVLPLASSPHKLSEKLQALGAGYLLISGRYEDFPLNTGSAEFANYFRRIYKGGSTELFTVSGTKNFKE